jgi:hypothetical protein
MTLFDCPSPKGTNRAKLYLNECGYLFDGRTGSYWGKSGIARMKMAMDQEPEHGETAEALLKMRVDIEECISEAHLDLHPEAKAEILKCLDRHVRPSQHQKRGLGPAWHERQERQARDDSPLTAFLRQKGLAEGHVAEAARLAEEHPRPPLRRVAGEANGRDDDEHVPDLEGIVRLLRDRGLSEDDVREALRIIGGGETADTFPTSGTLGGALSGHHREEGESPYQKHGVRHHGNHGATDQLDHQRRMDALNAIRRVGFVAGERTSPGRRMTKREKQIAYDNARAASGGLNSPFAEINENVNRILSGRMGRV